MLLKIEDSVLKHDWFVIEELRVKFVRFFLWGSLLCIFFFYCFSSLNCIFFIFILLFQGIIETQENLLVNFFETSPAEIWESEELSEYERLIMHGVTEYYQLRSKSKQWFFLNNASFIKLKEWPKKCFCCRIHFYRVDA